MHTCYRCKRLTDKWYYRNDGKRLGPCTACRGVLRKSYYRRSYGLTDELFSQMLASQGHRCAICGDTEPGGMGDWHIDHDRSCCSGSSSCGECVRGLLCTRCNVGLAMFRDSVTSLEAAIMYLGMRS